MVLGLLAHVTPSVLFSVDSLEMKLSLQFIFFSEQPFYGNYSTLDSHTNTVISHAFVYSSRWRRKPWQGLFLSSSHLKVKNIDSPFNGSCSHGTSGYIELPRQQYNWTIKRHRGGSGLPIRPLIGVMFYSALMTVISIFVLLNFTY